MKVVILCGGQGTRAYPYTRYMPKALMPVAGVPVVEQVMRIYAAQGFDDFVLAAGYLKEDLADYFRSRPQWRVQCLDTGASTDTGERILRCLDAVGDRFHATYCDGLGDVDLQELTAFHERHGDGATMTAAPLRSQYGILHTDGDDRITRFVEKPTLPEYWINAGFFVFDRSVFAGLPGKNLERDLLPEIANRGRLRAYRHAGFWRSMDTHKDQQELDSLWQPFASRFEQEVAAGARTELPAWLSERYALAAGDSA